MKGNSFGIRLGFTHYLYMFFFVVATIALFSMSKDSLTQLFLFIMAAFIIVAYGLGISRMYRVSRSLNNATNYIEITSDKEADQNFWQAIRGQEPFFKNKILENQFIQYKKEMNRLNGREETGINCDIAEYVNSDDLQDMLGRAYLVQMPGAMTGLGILGTFVGLTMGLTQFDSSTAETMAASIPVLMNGIKIAFYTSIYGVIYSILFNLLYHAEEGCLNESIERFCDAFHEKVIPIPENDIVNQLMKYQKEQIDSTKQFAETISVKMAESFRDLTTPTFERINDTMNSMSEKMVKNQSEGMGEVVDSFMQSMNNSMSGQFENLSETIKNTCLWQKKMMDDMQLTLEQVQGAASDLTNANDAMEKTINSLDAYSTKLVDFQNGVNKAYESIDKQRELFSNVTDKQTEYMGQLREHEDAINNSFEEITQNLHDLSQETKSQIDLNKELTTDLSVQINKSTDSLKSASAVFSNDVQTYLNKTFALFDSNLSDIAMHLSGTISEINETSDKLPKTTTLFLSSLEDSYQEYIEKVTSMQNDLGKQLQEKINSLQNENQHVTDEDKANA